MMTSDDPNSDPGEKMTEVTQNELIDSNQMLFSCLSIPLSFELGCVVILATLSPGRMWLRAPPGRG